jgi:Arylsulfatase regulator (Fe-S oxidoreductase)
MGKVLIKCIQTPMQKYFYDRSLDSVVMVNDEEYQILKTVEKTKLVPDGVLRRFVKSGLLRETAIEEIEHPETENLHLLAEHYMGNLILQVTQQCNLRCKYCAYSGNYYNRSHTSNRMDFETAKKAIDFYLKRSEKADQLALSFYGGEPLLEFELIKKCVSYILQRKGDKKILFTMTTNGTLMTEDVIEFLVKYEFNLMISLDGDKKSHDIKSKI